MKISYDDNSGALLIAFGDPARYQESREVVPGIVVDFDREGKALAIELEDAEMVLDTEEIRNLVHPRITRGADLRVFRERLGLTQEQLGDLIEVPRNTIARWERDELPIARARQLELALSGVLRPQVQRRFVITLSEDGENDFLECGFCGGRFALDLMELRDGKPTQETGALIHQHYDHDIDPDEVKIPRCRNWHRWKTCPWELRNTDDGTVIERGTVNLSAGGTIEIEKANLPSRHDLKKRRSS